MVNKFTGINHQEIANKIIESGDGDVVVNNLDKFTGLNHQEIANKIIEAGAGGAVADNLNKLFWASILNTF